jgi:hypothetical protein
MVVPDGRVKKKCSGVPWITSALILGKARSISTAEGNGKMPGYVTKFKDAYRYNGQIPGTGDYAGTLEMVTSRRITDTPRSPSSNTTGTHFA